ncbi:protein transporter [Wilcoxina mikolae CBS 423.85]|nr:protein transporter [Wilcoxina mikolae CBS 423.85]
MTPRIFAELGRRYRRAVVDAWDQAQVTKEYAAAAAQGRVSDSDVGLGTNQLTLSEACRILNVKPPQGGKTDMDIVMERFKSLYDVNEPDNGGSFYLQSKILRARERIEAEVRKAEEEAEQEEIQTGWKPKLFR